MSGGWEGSTRASRLPSDWPQRRQQRLDFDGHRCTWYTDGRRCTEPATEVDHRNPMTDDHRIEALRSLCAAHHAKKSSIEGNQARWKHRNQREPEKHPPKPRSTVNPEPSDTDGSRKITPSPRPPF